MIDTKQFKEAMSRFASGITVLTWYEDKSDHNTIQGITVSAFSSLSLQPPLVLFCIDHRAYVHPQLLMRHNVCINILSSGQTNLAYQFAGADRGQLAQHIHTHATHQLPLLTHAHANLIVHLTDRHRQGDHDIFIAEVIETHLPENSDPLLYHRGSIFNLTDSQK